MGADSQQVRPSQFILTYGPGSIIETPGGPAAIPSFSEMLDYVSRRADEFEVHDSRLQRIVGSRLVRLPSNSELERTDSSVTYPITRFPEWALCPRHAWLYHNEGCPDCPDLPPRELEDRSGREAIRFVRACPEGHVDDVHWPSVVHSGSPIACDYKGPFRWRGAGRAIGSIQVECPQCPATTSLGDAYRVTWPCSGRRLEDPGVVRPMDCVSRAQITQRSATNLHIPIHTSALTVMTTNKAIFDLISRPNVAAAFRMLRQLNPGAPLTAAALEQVINAAELGPEASVFLRRFEGTDDLAFLQQSVAQVIDEGGPDDEDALLATELDFLLESATRGAPPADTTRIGAPPLFEVPLDKVRTLARPGAVMRITPVTRLRMVVAQTAYARLAPSGPRTSVKFSNGDQEWVPAVELFGEGLFIDLAGTTLKLNGPRAADAAARHSKPIEPGAHPAYIWWHTLSHRLLNALAIDSGYSSAALQERIYVPPNSAANSVPPASGLLLYTVQPGGDGTLGGLTALAERFEEILALALSGVSTCSNDPLCSEQAALGDGAYCYSCLLVSETSCSDFNRGLDRLLLRDNLP